MNPLKRTFVIHCDKCKRLCEKGDEWKDCPPETNAPIQNLMGAHPTKFEPYYDKFQSREFTSMRDHDRYCNEHGFYKPTQAEITRHREEFQTSGPKAYRKRRIYVH